MKKIILVFCLTLSIQVFSQPDRFRRPNFENIPFQKPILTQTLVIDGDSLPSLYYLFKIPYKNIVFLKNDNDYKAGIRVDLEISDYKL